MPARAEPGGDAARAAMRRRRGGSWLVSAIAPWALAAATLVCITSAPDDDQEARRGVAPAYRIAVAPDPVLVAHAERFARATLLPPTEPPDVDTTASLAQPGLLRAQLKADAGDYPAVERDRKADPAQAIPVSLSRLGVELGASSLRVARGLAFARDAAVLPPTVLMRGPVDPPDWAESRRLTPTTEPGPALTRNASSVQSPVAAAAGSTGAAHLPGWLGGDGSTPRSARALVLSSTTPALADAAPVEVAAAPVSVRLAPAVAAMPATLPLRVEPDLQPRYAELLDPDKLDREQRCLAEAVYFEARSETEQGQAAVAQVVLNRVRSGLYPESVCGVVYQNRHHHLACQFTFACEGKLPRVTEPDAWEVAKRVALDVTDGRTYLADVGGATHYHADYVRPSWARRLKRMDVIGRHVFYQLRPGQT